MDQDPVKVHVLVGVVSFLFANETTSNGITEACLSTAKLSILQVDISDVIVANTHRFVVAFIFISTGYFVVATIVPVHFACFG